MTQEAVPILITYPKGMKAYISRKTCTKTIYSNSVHDGPKLETVHITGPPVICQYNNLSKNLTSETCRHLSGSQNIMLNQNPYSKEYSLYAST